MSWIKFEASTVDKPEVWQIAQALGMEPDTVIGKLIRVWLWFDEHTLDGNAPSVTKALLESKISVTGFCNAMIAAGWMVEREGTISLPNFDRHNGKTAKNRALTAKRVINHRVCNDSVTLESNKCNDDSVTKALPEKNRERVDKNNNTPLPPRGRTRKPAYEFNLADIPDSLKIGNPQEFYRAWATWIAHRQEIKKPITPTSAQQQLKQMSDWGADRAIAAMEYTIRKGWQGLTEPEGKEKPDTFFEDFQKMHERVTANLGVTNG